jgi:hypothetical protein
MLRQQGAGARSILELVDPRFDACLDGAIVHAARRVRQEQHLFVAGDRPRVSQADKPCERQRQQHPQSSTHW